LDAGGAWLVNTATASNAKHRRWVDPRDEGILAQSAPLARSQPGRSDGRRQQRPLLIARSGPELERRRRSTGSVTGVPHQNVNVRDCGIPGRKDGAQLELRSDRTCHAWVVLAFSGLKMLNFTANEWFIPQVELLVRAVNVFVARQIQASIRLGIDH
jgi:hypothetical protein